MAKQASHTKFMGLFLIVGSLVLLSLWLTYDFLPALKEPQKKNRLATKSKKNALQKLWEEDINKMLEERIFDKGIGSIRKVRVFMLDKNLHSQFKKLKTPFKYSKNGQNLLEVSFMSHHSDIDNSEKLIVQYNLTDKDSGNMFWEHSRTITIPNSIVAN